MFKATLADIIVLMQDTVKMGFEERDVGHQSLEGFKRNLSIFGLSIELFPSCVVAIWSSFALQLWTASFPYPAIQLCPSVPGIGGGGIFFM